MLRRRYGINGGRPSSIIRLGTAQLNKASTNGSQTSGHERVRHHQPCNNRRRKHWRPEGAICHEGRGAEAKQYKRNCLCVSMDTRPISERRQLSASVSSAHPYTLPLSNRPRWTLFIGGNSRRSPPSSSAEAPILAESLRQCGNADVTNLVAGPRTCVSPSVVENGKYGQTQSRGTGEGAFRGG